MIGFCTSMCSFLVANINGVILKVSTAFTSAPLQESTVPHFHIHMRFSLPDLHTLSGRQFGNVTTVS